MDLKKYDIVIVGAGSSGSAAAYLLAKNGYKIALLEKKNFNKAGSRWVNDVPLWMFDRAGISPPNLKEKHCDCLPFTILDKNNNHRIYLPQRPMWGVNMPYFINRLQNQAFEAGVEGYDNINITHFDFNDDRPVKLYLEANSDTNKTKNICFSAGLFIDATGMAQSVLRQVPALSKHCPPPNISHTCNAAQKTYEIIDSEGAKSFLAGLNCMQDEFICWTGICGGFSTLMFKISKDFSTIDILTGVMLNGENGTGLHLMEKFKIKNSWIGEKISGGAGLIPLRRPYDMFASPGVALIGDAACQVFPAHGSGVGSGLIAANILSEAVKSQSDCGSIEAVWEYQSIYQREIGSIHGFYEIFTRTSQELLETEVDKLISRLMPTSAIEASFNQYIPNLFSLDLLPTVFNSISTPFLTSKILSKIPKMISVYFNYKKYPLEPDMKKILSWSKISSLLGGFNNDLKQ